MTGNPTFTLLPEFALERALELAFNVVRSNIVANSAFQKAFIKDTFPLGDISQRYRGCLANKTIF